MLQAKKALKKHAFNFFANFKKLKNTGLILLQAEKGLKNMDLMFCKLKKLKKHGINFFASVKKLKKT